MLIMSTPSSTTTPSLPASFEKIRDFIVIVIITIAISSYLIIVNIFLKIIVSIITKQQQQSVFTTIITTTSTCHASKNLWNACKWSTLGSLLPLCVHEGATQYPCCIVEQNFMVLVYGFYLYPMKIVVLKAHVLLHVTV